jgi:xylulokinase
MYLLGYDIGSSFIKASLLDAGSGKLLAAASAPDSEMNMISHQPGWAEQDQRYGGKMLNKPLPA